MGACCNLDSARTLLKSQVPLGSTGQDAAITGGEQPAWWRAWEVRHPESLARRGEGCATRIAAVSLNSQSSIGAKLFSGPVLTFQASHWAPLAFLREKPDNQSLGSECGLRPRLDSAPSLAETSDGAFFYSLIFIKSLFVKSAFSKERTRGTVRSPRFLPIPESFLNPTALYKSIQYGVDRREWIAVLSKTPAQLFKFCSNFACTQRMRRGGHDSVYVIGKAGINKPAIGRARSP